MLGEYCGEYDMRAEPAGEGEYDMRRDGVGVCGMRCDAADDGIGGDGNCWPWYSRGEATSGLKNGFRLGADAANAGAP